MEIDIDRLHEIHSFSGRGAGHTTAMLINAIQQSDFAKIDVMILGNNLDHSKYHVRLFCEIAKALDFKFEVTHCNRIVLNGVNYEFTSLELFEQRHPGRDVIVFRDPSTIWNKLSTVLWEGENER